MRPISKILALCAAIIFMIAATGTAGADPLVFTYHGWQVDLTNAKGAEPDREMAATVKRQLDIVEHVNLKPDVLTFMRTIRIWANPAAAKRGPATTAARPASTCASKVLRPTSRSSCMNFCMPITTGCFRADSAIPMSRNSSISASGSGRAIPT